MNTNIQLLQERLQKKKIDFAFFANLDGMSFQAEMLYFANYQGYGSLIIPQHGKPVLIVPALDVEKARKTGIPVMLWQKKKMIEILTETLKKNHWKKESIGINFATTTLQLYLRLKKDLSKKLINIEEELTSLRRTKTPQEREIIRKACALHCAIFDELLLHWKAFKTEADVAAYFQYLAAKNGCPVSFPTIVASGKNASQPHHETSDEKLQKGFCVIDCGIKYKNYCTDMTRTVFLGTPTSKEKELYAKVLTAQEKVMRKYIIGAHCKDLEKEARRLLGKEAKNMIHSLGHGVGLEVHEAPSVSMRSKDTLKEGDYVTNEPGLYYPGKLGIRIEDDILITKKGPFVLTEKCGKELKILPY